MSMTDEQKKAASERMKAFHAAKNQPTPAAEAPKTSTPDYGDLLALVNELKGQIDELKTARLAAPPQAPQSPQQPLVNAQGSMVGSYIKYALDAFNYADPTQRLAKEPKLSRFAFDINYELTWTVMPTFYTTVDGVKTREPRFVIELNRVMLDEDTGEDTLGRYTIRTFVFHEDPEAAITVANEQGIDVSGFGEKEFLDEMRYLRARAWLLEAFYPPKRDADKKNKKEMAIGGKLVQYFEISSPDSKGVPFGELGNKL